MNDLEVIGDVLELDEEDAGIVLGLCDWIEHEVMIAEHGYPRDNAMPRPMRERLADPDYLERLLGLSLDEDVPERVSRAVEGRLTKLRALR